MLFLLSSNYKLLYAVILFIFTNILNIMHKRLSNHVKVYIVFQIIKIKLYYYYLAISKLNPYSLNSLNPHRTKKYQNSLCPTTEN